MFIHIFHLFLLSPSSFLFWFSFFVFFLTMNRSDDVEDWLLKGIYSAVVSIVSTSIVFICMWKLFRHRVFLRRILMEILTLMNQNEQEGDEEIEMEEVVRPGPGPGPRPAPVPPAREEPLPRPCPPPGQQAGLVPPSGPQTQPRQAPPRPATLPRPTQPPPPTPNTAPKVPMGPALPGDGQFRQGPGQSSPPSPADSVRNPVSPDLTPDHGGTAVQGTTPRSTHTRSPTSPVSGEEDSSPQSKDKTESPGYVSPSATDSDYEAIGAYGQSTPVSGTSPTVTTPVYLPDSSPPSGNGQYGERLDMDESAGPPVEQAPPVPSSHPDTRSEADDGGSVSPIYSTPSQSPYTSPQPGMRFSPQQYTNVRAPNPPLPPRSGSRSPTPVHGPPPLPLRSFTGSQGVNQPTHSAASAIQPGIADVIESGPSHATTTPVSSKSKTKRDPRELVRMITRSMSRKMKEGNALGKRAQDVTDRLTAQGSSSRCKKEQEQDGSPQEGATKPKKGKKDKKPPPQ